MRGPSPKRISSLHQKIPAWYRRHRRQFLWRNTHDPYIILVSEIMLQQTQAQRVNEKLPLFLRRFPSFSALAKAPKADVIRGWRGMGYNNRAVRLRELAQAIIGHYRGKLPADINSLRGLPGIGPYTAHAVACFALGQIVPVVDVNVERVLSRLFWPMKCLDERMSKDIITRMAQRLLPEDAYVWNQALMEFGALVCTAMKPSCSHCSINDVCCSRNLELVATQTARRKAVSRKKLEPMHVGIPQRLWRGKIVEVLRNVDGEGVSLPKLGKKIKLDFSRSELQWLNNLIVKLEHDGILVRRGTGSASRISLPG